MNRILIAAVRLYQLLVRPLLPPVCRFYPSCSDYALVSLERHGPLRGSLMAAWRLLRCHPFHPGGYDPVPARPGPPRICACGDAKKGEVL